MDSPAITAANDQYQAALREYRFQLQRAMASCNWAALGLLALLYWKKR